MNHPPSKMAGYQAEASDSMDSLSRGPDAAPNDEEIIWDHSPDTAFSADESRIPLTAYSQDGDDHKFEDMGRESLGKPLKRSRRRARWNPFGARARSNANYGIHLNHMPGEVGDGLLSDMYRTTTARRKRSWSTCCIFGGISGLSVLAILLVVNLLLIIASLFYSEDVDRVLHNWGRPGSGTEGLAWYPTDFTRDILPVPCHSHNDYWRRVPLFSALRAGCTGVEADVWLFDEELYVGHNTASLTRNRTFQSLYINPLVEILEQQNPNTDFYNGTSHGVYDTDSGKSLILLVDLKTNGPETWPWVLKQLEPLRERGWLTYYENNTVNTRPVTVVGTGNTPFDVLIANSTYRDAFFDAPIDTMWEPRHGSSDVTGPPHQPFPDESLDGSERAREESFPTFPSTTRRGDAGQGKSGTLPSDEFNQFNSYYASVSFNAAVGRVWKGKLSSRQMEILRGQIRGAHRRGLKARYWDLPSWPIGLRNHVWDVLVQEGVDMLNVDDLRAASRRVW